MMTAAMAVASAASTLVVGDAAGAGWAGAAPTAGIVGTGCATLLLPRVIGRRGRRRALLGAYLTALAGALLAAAAAPGHPVGVVVGLGLLGTGNGAAQLSRYLVGDLFPPARRGSAIALVVFAATIGAVGGPLLLGSTSAPARALGVDAAGGPFLLAAVAVAAALATMPAVPSGTVRPPAAVRISAVLKEPGTRSPLTAMVTAQVVMVAVMTAAPLEMHHAGAGLGTVGAVLSAHTAGMFVLAPLTGRLVDRHGAHAVMLAGLAVAAVACAFVTGVAGTGGAPHGAVYLVLGVAWNLAFVGGSTAVSQAVGEDRRLAVEGAVDTVVWSSAAIAGALSTVLLSSGGLRLLGAITAAGALVAATAVGAARPSRVGAAGRG
jgi:MFS family permease